MIARAVFTTLALASLASCGEVEQVARTQVTLQVDGDETLRKTATVLRAALFLKDGDGWTPRSEVRIESPALKFPIDIPILPGRTRDQSAEIEIILEAFEVNQPIARTRAVTTFKPDKHVTASAMLVSCDRASVICPDQDEGCHGAECQVCRGDACVVAGNAPSSEDGLPSPGEPLSDGGKETAAQPESDGGERKPEAPASDAGTPATDAGSPPLLKCPADHTCKAPYECEVTPSGYTCRGQMADWPMPDPIAPSKVKPDYVVNGRTITERSTKLEWQLELPAIYPECSGSTPKGDHHPAAPAGSTCTQREAIRYCEHLDDGRGFRLPTLIELMTLFTTDYKGYVATDVDKFAAPYYRFITASSPPDAPASAWVLDFEEQKAERGTNMYGKVRCVRGGAVPSFGKPSERYSVKGGFVTDRATGLVWQQGFSEPLQEPETDAYCQKLKMRVPTPNELMTLVDPTRGMPTIDIERFPGTPSAVFYAKGQPYDEKNETLRYYVDFEDGSFGLRVFGAHVRCVRNE